jgi:hypothetical protein
MGQTKPHVGGGPGAQSTYNTTLLRGSTSGRQDPVPDLKGKYLAY